MVLQFNREEEEVEMKWADGTNCTRCRKTKTKTPVLRHSGVSDSVFFSDLTAKFSTRRLTFGPTCHRLCLSRVLALLLVDL